MNVTHFVLQRLGRGTSSTRGLLNELPDGLPNGHHRLMRALRTLRRRGNIRKCYPGGDERPRPGMLKRDMVWMLGREPMGCPCHGSCCEKPDPVPLDLQLRDAGEDEAAIPPEYRWWSHCRNCERRCNCEV